MKRGNDEDYAEDDEVDDGDEDDDERLQCEQQVAGSEQHGRGRQYDQLARLTISSDMFHQPHLDVYHYHNRNVRKFRLICQNQPPADV